jgi:hypothetical protein
LHCDRSCPHLAVYPMSPGAVITRLLAPALLVR